MKSAHRSTSLPVPGVSLSRVIGSEWIKLRSLRSTVAILLGVVVVIVGAGSAMTLLIAEPMAAGTWDPGGDPFSPHDPTAAMLYGVQFAQLLIGVLGVTIASSEYGTGMIHATLTAVPTRLPVLWAKISVVGLVTFALTLVAVMVTFWIAGMILSGAGIELSFAGGGGGGQPGNLGLVRAILVGAPLYLAGVGILAITLGFLLRNTAAAVAVFFVVMFFLSPLLGLLLPGGIGRAFASYLPSAAGAAFMAATPRAGMLPPWTGFGVFLGYLAIMVAAAAVVLKIRDA